MAQVATKYANKVPEYREEYSEIASSCSELAVDILNECVNTKEVELFLQERSGVKEYFRMDVAKKIKYPKLQMAIQRNHKTFVGHMFCQQILRDQWHGQVPWNGRSLRFRVLYSFFQMTLTIFFVMHHIARTICRDLGVNPTKNRKNKYLKSSLNFIMGPCNLDEPINRFLSFTGMYFAFCSLIIVCILKPITDPQQLTNNFHWYHDLLVIFSLSMFINDVIAMISVKTTMFKFWRWYDIIMHLTLGSAFLTRLLMGKLHECADEFNCDSEIIEARVPYDTASNCIFAFASTMACMRLLYWFQLEDTLGPLVIYLNRIIYDVLMIGSVFSVTILAFASGLVPLAASNLYRNETAIDNGTGLFVYQGKPSRYDLFWRGAMDKDNGVPGDIIKGYWAIFWEMISLLFWTILNPEEPEVFDSSTLDGYFGVIIVATYAVIAVIILLNLLIALMNTTITRIQDNKHLYWKFTRTCIWIEYFGDDMALPEPFSLFTVIRKAVKSFTKLIREKMLQRELRKNSVS